MIFAAVATFPLGGMKVLRKATSPGAAFGGSDSEVHIQEDAWKVATRSDGGVGPRTGFPIHVLAPQSLSDRRPVVKFDDAVDDPKAVTTSTLQKLRVSGRRDAPA